MTAVAVHAVHSLSGSDGGDVVSMSCTGAVGQTAKLVINVHVKKQMPKYTAL